MAEESYTPTERLLVMSLLMWPGQTPEQLQKSTGVKTKKHLLRALRTLRMANIIALYNETEGTCQYAVKSAGAQ